MILSAVFGFRQLRLALIANPATENIRSDVVLVFSPGRPDNLEAYPDDMSSCSPDIQDTAFRDGGAPSTLQ
jgi:hypothetical protein